MGRFIGKDYGGFMYVFFMQTDRIYQVKMPANLKACELSENSDFLINERLPSYTQTVFLRKNQLCPLLI